jgi:hypothetical protein
VIGARLLHFHKRRNVGGHRCGRKGAAVWNAKTGARLHTLPHGGPVNWIAYHPKGDRLITAAEDGTVRLRDADRADALLSVTVPERTPAARMWFPPDGSRVNLVGGGKALGVAVPQFEVPADLTGPLVRLLTGRRIDETDGIEFVDQFTFRTDPAIYRRAFLGGGVSPTTRALSRRARLCPTAGSRRDRRPLRPPQTDFISPLSRIADNTVTPRSAELSARSAEQGRGRS